MKLKTLSRHSLVDAVLEQLHTYIRDGKFVPGDRLPTEPELTANLGVSRTVLREAIGRLETIGLLEVRRGLGMFVGSGSSLSSSAQLMRSALTMAPRELLKFAEFRGVIEAFSARRAAELATAEDIAELDAICDEMHREGQEYLESVRLDFKLHFKLVEITGNELMMNVMRVLQEFIIAGMVKTTPKPRNREGSFKLHKEIVDAVRTRDPKIAGAVIDHHINLIKQALLRAEENPQL